MLEYLCFMNPQLAESILNIILYFSAFIFAFFSWHVIYFYIITCKKEKKIPHNENYSKFAVLIPARNESRVIKNLLNCLKKQTYPQKYFDVYVIVEEENDPTINIVKNLGYKIFVRDRLTPDRCTKGYALQECIDYFKRENILYDAYMIFDADNLIDDNFIEVMNDLRGQEVEIGVGYRNFTNPNQNILASSSAIFFSYMNNVTSRGRSMTFDKAVIMGTGYYVNASIIDEAGGWIFVGMTEDTELTAYAYKHDIKMYYTKSTCIYDEQAPHFRVWHNQHVRWIWGYLNDFKDVLEKGVDHHTLSKKRYQLAKVEYKVSFIPAVASFAIIALGAIAEFIFGIIALIQNVNGYRFFFNGLMCIFVLLFIFTIQAFGQIIRENRKIKMGIFFAIYSCLTYWIIYIDLVVSFFDGLFHKDKRTTWKPIKHDGKITSKKAKKIKNE